MALVKSGASVSTRTNVFLALRSVAKFAVEAKILAQMPKCFPLLKRGKRVPSAPPAPDVAAAIGAASCPEHRLVILLAAHAGLRKGEIRALRCGDVELEHNRLVVRLSRYRTHTRSTKSGHERQVPLSPQPRAALIAARVRERPRDEEAALSTQGKRGCGRCSGSVASRGGSACCGRGCWVESVATIWKRSGSRLERRVPEMAGFVSPFLDLHTEGGAPD